MRNIFNQFNYKNLFVFNNIDKNNDTFDACVREHIQRKDDPESCYLRDVAFYEMEIELSGLDNVYTFIMQPAVACRIELEACTNFMETIVYQ